jgi:sulfonate transport system ATP-binding protein
MLPVLGGVDLTLAPGEFVAVVGRSGCGKSTLLRLAAGLEVPDAGEVRIDGEPLRGLHPDIRVIFQDARLLPWRRVRDNVALGLPREIAPERTAEALASVGLAERAGDWPGALSAEQRQRVALARALAGSPRLLLLDEPLGTLNALLRQEMQELIERLWQARGFTALLVTHDVAEAVALADRVILIDAGRIALDLAVPLPRPRDRASSDFNHRKEAVLARLLCAAPTEDRFDTEYV